LKLGLFSLDDLLNDFQVNAMKDDDKSKEHPSRPGSNLNRRRFESPHDASYELQQPVADPIFELIRQAPYGMFLLDLSGKIVAANDQGASMLGKTVDQVLGTTLRDYFPPEIAENLKQKGTEALTSRKAIRFEDQFGGRRYHNIIVPISRSDGKITHLAIYGTDITERFQAAQSLVQSENRFRQLFDHMSNGVAIYEAVNDGEDFVFKDLNRAGLLQGKKKKEEVIGHSVREVFSGVEELGLLEVFKRVWKSGRPEHHPASLYRDNEVTLWVENYVCKLPCGEIVAVYEDTTARHQAETALKESEVRYRSVVESLNEGVILQLSSGEIRTWNRSAERIFRIPAAEAIGRTSVDYDWHVIYEDGTECPGKEHPSMITLRTGEALRNQIRGIRHNEENITWLSINTVPLFERGQGKPSAIITSFTDITEQKNAREGHSKLEAQLRQAQKMEAVGTLAGGIAHDFNNILTAIIGYTELALEENRDGRTSPEELEQVMKSAERARDLVRRILAFSRKAEADFRPFDLNRTVKQVAEMLERTIPRMIRIDVHIEDQPSLIHGDAGQIEQVLLNLASNAKDAMPEGGRLVFEVGHVNMDKTYYRLHPADPSGECAQLIVSDTGHGMDKETLEHIYDPFYTTKEVGKGTGMGLAMVYGIVKNHGGYISCYSEPNQGTSFKIYIPKLKKEAYLTPEDPSVEDSSVGKETILIVDDEPALRDIAARILTRSGYQVFQAESGEAALEVYQESPGKFDLVILDIGMPGMGGHRCLERLKRIDPDSRVIIASGYSKNGPIKRSVASGAAGYVGKPFTKAELLRSVRQVLDAES